MGATERTRVRARYQIPKNMNSKHLSRTVRVKYDEWITANMIKIQVPTAPRTKQQA